MSEVSKPAFYDLPLYMRIFPFFFRNEYFEYRVPKPYERDAFEDFTTLYSLFAVYGLITPNTWYGGYYW